ncbi:hypothetical protein Oweho_0074 [Owenweeksia hongkongensis DSM 17368]|uniref:Lipoprotein n=1 Tax=Owenweeksia hongkongensis (strain DSM 17368 / CIP 108786 / JCM 12287 / NRRL B-23963 / UST20020801) TaxID=926562 RepID=G8R5V0_OWEHD|nr:hypothetical protein [Owenweeksia hongkongensis]AEV31098.1 hypothetical protein Oweho_0074 [Owenweeksia hongkongensis DSM 17368]
MKKLMLATCLLAILVSCTKEDPNTYLDLDFRCSQSSQSAYKNINFKVEKVMLHKKNGDTVQYQNLPNSSKDFFFSFENPEPIWLDSWKLKPLYIKHIELDISEMTLKKDSTYITCKIPEYWKCIYKDVNSNLEKSSGHWISIGLDLRKTVILDSANEYWIKPVFSPGFGV